MYSFVFEVLVLDLTRRDNAFFGYLKNSFFTLFNPRFLYFQCFEVLKYLFLAKSFKLYAWIYVFKLVFVRGCRSTRNPFSRFGTSKFTLLCSFGTIEAIP